MKVTIPAKAIRLPTLALAALLIIVLVNSINALNEADRLVEYEKRGYEWPLSELVPNTPGWRTIFERRFEQVETTIEDSTQRYNAWMNVVSSSFLQPNFTENGYV